MYSDKRTNQGGSVAVFLIVSVVLAATVIGGIYVVHQRGEQARTMQPIAQQSNKNDQQPDPQPQPTQQSQDEAKKQEEARKQAEAAKQAETAKKAEEAKKKADQEAAVKQRQDQAAKEQAQKQAAAQNTPAVPVPQTGYSPDTSHLPTTGPEDTLPQLIAGGVMIAIIGAYLRSYRHRFGSLLR